MTDGYSRVELEVLGAGGHIRHVRLQVLQGSDAVAVVGGADLAHGTKGRTQLVRQEVQVVREVADLARVVDHLLAAGVVVAVDAEAGGFAPVQVLHVAGSGLHHVLVHPLLVDGKSRDGL